MPLSGADGLAGGCGQEHVTGSGGEQAFPSELVALCADPEIRRFALRRAGDPDLAEDALLQAICVVARVQDLQAIEDLRAYFCRALIDRVYRLRGQLTAARPDPAREVLRPSELVP
jgi:DNA-directed RNA polymerase specialized sigma24 family protein